MSFEVEDGTGENPDANSYVSVADFKAYWDSRGFDWTVYVPDAKLERALVQATDYIELINRNNFKGCRLLDEQPLSWPRAYAFWGTMELTEVPAQLKKATFEYAKIALTSSTGLIPVPQSTDASGQVIQETYKKMGPIEKRTVYETGTALKPYPAADRLLSELLYASGGVIRN